MKKYNHQDETFKSKVRCFFGKHDWGCRVVSTRRGLAVGDCCCRCGDWADNSFRESWEEIKQEKDFVI